MSSDPYATDESPTVLWNERSINAAVYIGAIAYGFHASVSIQTVSAIFQSSKTNWKWLPLTFVLFAMATINIACSINYNQLAWIDERNYPNGPLAFIVQQSSRSVNTASIATSVVTLFLADAFLVYRCHALWKKIYVTIALTAFLVASTVLSIIHCVQTAKPDAGLWDNDTVKISVPYASVSMTLNALLTIILGWRVLDLRRRLPATLNQQAKQLITLQALVIETALPFGLVSFIFVIFYGLQSAVANLFVCLLVQLEGIVPELIIMRMVSGKAWSADIVRPVGVTSTVFRGTLGRLPSTAAETHAASGRDDISMITLQDEAHYDSKVGQDFV